MSRECGVRCTDGGIMSVVDPDWLDGPYLRPCRLQAGHDGGHDYTRPDGGQVAS